MNLAVLLDMAQSGHGERKAFGGWTDGITFEQLARDSAAGAAVLLARGARHAVLLGRNGPNMPQLLFAAALAGIPFTPVNYRLGAEQVRELVAELDSPLVVADSEYAPIVARHSEVVTTADFIGLAARSDAAPAVEIPDSAPAVMLFTSGTTAKPKIVPLRHVNLTSYILAAVEFGSAAESDAALVTVPPYHIAGIASVLSNLHAGRRVVYLPDFDPAEWLRLVAAEEITSAMLVPTMLARIVDHLGESKADAPALQTISYGGGRMPLPVLEKALKAFPDCGFVNAYGLTETSSTIALLTPEDHRVALAARDAAGRARLGSVGRPLPGIEIDIRDPDGTSLGASQEGELWVRGSQVSGEYVGRGSVLDADGWFPTQDRAQVDAGGYLFIEGRADDTIIRGGENISAAEIEEALLRHPEVAQVAAVGVPDDEWGQRLVAVVVRRQGAEVTQDELKAFVRSRLRGSRTPDAVVWRAELPYTETGKLLRRDLVADLATPPA